MAAGKPACGMCVLECKVSRLVQGAKVLAASLTYRDWDWLSCRQNRATLVSVMGPGCVKRALQQQDRYQASRFCIMVLKAGL